MARRNPSASAAASSPSAGISQPPGTGTPRGIHLNRNTNRPATAPTVRRTTHGQRAGNPFIDISNATRKCRQINPSDHRPTTTCPRSSRSTSGITSPSDPNASRRRGGIKMSADESMR
jgi:hypothetical protein